MISLHQLVMSSTTCTFCSRFIDHCHPDWCSLAYNLVGRKVIVCIPCGAEQRSLLQQAL